MKKLILLIFITYIAIYAQSAARLDGSPYPVSTIPDTLYAISDNYSQSQMLTIETLQGVLAQTKPRIFRITNSSYTIWLDDLKNNYGVTVISSYDGDFAGLIKLFKNEISGYILCDTNDNSVNVAISLCGLNEAIAVTANNESVLTGLGIPLLADVRGKDEAWFFDNYGSQVNKNIFCFQKENLSFFLADYAAFGKMITFYNSTYDAGTNKIFASFNPNSVLFGWGADEFQLVQEASDYNVIVHATDYASNLSTFSNFEAKAEQKKAYDTVRNDENYHTVCFLMTDGDNIQWLLDSFVDDTDYYASPSRGKMKLGWGVSPAMAEVAPTVLKYLYDNETSGSSGRDYFVTGVSGLGYIYPDKYKDLDGFAGLTSKYMQKSDLRIVNVLGNIDSAKYLLPLLKQDNIDAIFYYFYSDYSGGHGKISFVNNKPVIYGRYNLWDGFETSTSLAQKLNAASKNIYSPEGYSLIPVHVWSRNVTDVLNCTNLLNSNVRVVAPDEFVSLISKNLKPRTSLLQFVPNGNSTELSYLVQPDTGTSHNKMQRWADYNNNIIYKFNLDTLLSESGNVKDLFLNFLVAKEYVVSVSSSMDSSWTEVLRWNQDSTVHAHTLSNEFTQTIKLNDYYSKGWHTLYLKFEDGIKSDAYGAAVFNISVTQPEVVAAVKSSAVYLPSEFKLAQNYPNPFNPSTRIEYQLSKSGYVTLKIYDILGREIKTLVEGNEKAGNYSVSFNATKLASGVYFYRLSANGFTSVKKMVLAK
jgi:hypothetical protein